MNAGDVHEICHKAAPNNGVGVLLPVVPFLELVGWLCERVGVHLSAAMWFVDARGVHVAFQQ